MKFLQIKGGLKGFARNAGWLLYPFMSFVGFKCQYNSWKAYLVLKSDMDKDGDSTVL